jgi:hypothetical protein
MFKLFDTKPSIAKVARKSTNWRRNAPLDRKIIENSKVSIAMINVNECT